MVTFTVFFSISEQGQSGREVCHSEITVILRPRTCVIPFSMYRTEGSFARSDFCSSKNLTQSKKLTSQHKALPNKPLPVILQQALKAHHRTMNLQ